MKKLLISMLVAAASLVQAANLRWNTEAAPGSITVADYKSVYICWYIGAEMLEQYDTARLVWGDSSKEFALKGAPDAGGYHNYGEGYQYGTFEWDSAGNLDPLDFLVKVELLKEGVVVASSSSVLAYDLVWNGMTRAPDYTGQSFPGTFSGTCYNNTDWWDLGPLDHNNPAPIPEPATATLASVGVGMLFYRKRRN